MIRIYYMKLSSDCSQEQSLALLYGTNKMIVIPGSREEMYQCLPKERKEAVDRAKNETVAWKRLCAGAFLQCVLGEEMGIPMERFVYTYNEWGKPELDKETMLEAFSYTGEEKCVIQDMHFNLSHSGDYVVLAIGSSPVGIDVEHKTKGYDTLPKRCFCEEEYEDILQAGDERAQKMRFLEYWTMKEAYIKCVGEGMRIPLNSFLVKGEKDDIAIMKKMSGDERLEPVCGGTLWLDSDYCVSVCRVANSYD